MVQNYELIDDDLVVWRVPIVETGQWRAAAEHDLMTAAAGQC
jgi:hypothetical protein